MSIFTTFFDFLRPKLKSELLFRFIKRSMPEVSKVLLSRY